MDLDEDRIRNYLLAELPEEERDTFETEFFRDGDLFDLVRAVEDDLIDDYVTGALSDKARRRFSEHYLTSPERQRRVDFARALREAVMVADQPARPARAPVLRAVWALVSFNRPTLRLALVAAAVLVVVSGTLVWELRPEDNQPPILVALRDTSGPTTFASDETVVLAALGALPPPLARLVREFVTTGSATLEPSAEPPLNALRGEATRGALRSGQGAVTPTPVPIGPMLTAVRASQPTLRWKGVPDVREYKVLVADRDDNVVWQASAGVQTQATVPAAVLQVGHVYFWQVQALVDRDSRRTPPVGFWLIDEQTLRGVEAIEQTYQGSALVLAATYAAHGLYEEALTQVERLAQLNPGSAEVQAMLNQLRRQLGQQ